MVDQGILKWGGREHATLIVLQILQSPDFLKPSIPTEMKPKYDKFSHIKKYRTIAFNTDLFANVSFGHIPSFYSVLAYFNCINVI